MKKDNHQHFVFSPGVILYPIFFVLSIWIVFWIEIKFNFNFNDWGINPGNLSGLKGIFSSPFIHSSLKHLFHNTIPLFILSMALFYFYRNISWKILIYGVLLTGLLTWFIGRPANHIGASGIIYMLTGFLFFKGVFSRHYRLIALSLIVVFLYGGMIWYVFPNDPKISWEGHLSGLVVGFLLSLFYKNSLPEISKYEWEKADYKEEQDPFMQYFDEN